MKLDYKKDYFELKVNPELNGILSRISDTKHAQEVAIVSKIMQLLNDNVYNSIDDLYGKNNSIQVFLKHHFEVPIAHFGYNEPPFTEEDYKVIIENMKAVIKQKQSVETKDIKTTKTDEATFNSTNIDGENHFIDSTNDPYENIADRIENDQPNSDEFQTVDPQKNAENIFKDIESKQEGLNLKRLGEINLGTLNNEEMDMFTFAMNYQVSNMTPIQVDVDKRVIVDDQGTIIKVIKEDGVLKLATDEEKKNEEDEIKSPQKKLATNQNTIYSN